MGTLTLPTAGSVYIDANTAIYSVEKIEPYWTLLQPLWAAAQADQFIIISSELLLFETLVKPFQKSDTILETSFRNLLLHSREVQLRPMTLSILEAAARLRATTGLKTPDAIHAATALAANITLFLTNDSDFRRVPSLPVTLLSEIVASSP
jgi:predicted nucleic acid-binding protein